MCCEARTKFGDWANIDLRILRSTDNGNTFIDTCIIPASEWCKTANNPVLIVGNDNKTHFLFCVEYGLTKKGGGIYYAYSDDDGLTFSEPKNISKAFLPLSANVIALGPRHGICLKNNNLILPIWYIPKEENKPEYSHHPGRVAKLFSEDNGKSWIIGETLKTELKDVNESVMAELSNGKIIINVRINKAGYRGVAIKNGYDWSSIVLDKNLIDPTCFGSICTYQQELYFVNCDHNNKRKNLTIKESLDFGKNFNYLITIHKKTAGYADIAASSDGKIFVAYEIKGGRRCCISEIKINSK